MKAARLVALGLTLSSISTLACSGRRPPRTGPVIERGTASWYGPGFHGRRTANGEIYDQDRLTAAHRTLPFDSLLEVVNLDNGRRVSVRVNDRGPFAKGRIIDLSRGAARALDMIGPGTARVELREIGRSSVVAGPADPAPSGRRFAVQVGAFVEAERARALASALRPRHPDVAVESDEAWHRVVLAVFDRRAEAERLRQRAEEEGIEAFVVALEPARSGRRDSSDH